MAVNLSKMGRLGGLRNVGMEVFGCFFIETALRGVDFSLILFSTSLVIDDIFIEHNIIKYMIITNIKIKYNILPPINIIYI